MTILLFKVLSVCAFGLVFYSVLARLHKEKFARKNKLELKKEIVTERRRSQVEKWQKALLELGETPSIQHLEDVVTRHVLSENKIPYEAVLTRKEFKMIARNLTKGSWVKETMYLESLELNRLPALVKAKRLAPLADAFSESLTLLNEKRENTSSEFRKERYELDNERLRIRKEMDALCEIEMFSNKLLFSRVYHLSEEELMQIAKKNLETAYQTQSDKEKQPVLESKSPALLELNQFLTEHELPKEIQERVEQTISDIQKKLEKEKTERKDEQLSLQADVLIQTSRTWHNVPEKEE